MRKASARFALAALLLTLGMVPVAARAAGTPVRVGDHPGFSRVVFDLPPGATAETVVEGDRVLLVFKGVGTLDRPSGQARNVMSLTLDGATATLLTSPGARLRRQRFGNRLVLDILDPKAPDAKAANAAKAPTPTLRKAPMIEPESVSPSGQPAAARPGLVDPTAGSHHAEVAPVVEPAPAIPVARAELAPSLAPVHVSAAAEATSPGRPPILLPADMTVGAAAFRRNGVAMIVLDRRFSPGPPPMPGVIVTAGQVSTTLEVPVGASQAIRLGRTQAGWTFEIIDAEASAQLDPSGAPISDPATGNTAFPQPRPGRVVAVADPASGGTLLIGTSLTAGPGFATPERRTPEYAILPAWQGVAVEPLSDRVDLRPLPAGFLLTGGSALPKAVPVESAWRRFDLPDEPIPALLNRLQAQLATAAAAAPRARGPARRAAAEAMLALGLGVEAQALLQQLMAEDPQSAADAQIRALAAAAAVVAWRLDEADALDDPSLGETPETLMWRGVRDRRRGHATPAAAALASFVPFASAYPGPLKQRVWPDIAEAAAEAKRPIPEGTATPFAAALAVERSGTVADALAAWTALAASPDRLDATRATVRGAELALASGQATLGQAADTLERQVFAWRGDGRELGLRLRVAELRAANGEWRAALDALRTAETMFPEQAAAVRPGKAEVFKSMLAAEGHGLSALEVVLLAADYADCVPEGDAGVVLARLLADKLVALDLPARAIPVLQGLVKGAAGGPARAEFGARLTQLLLEGGDIAGASAALQASNAPGLPTALEETRNMLQARLRAAQGDVSGAAVELKALDTAAADELRATILAAASDWRGSLDALNDLAARSMPGEGPLSEAAQAVVLRQANAAIRLNDPSVLRSLSALLPRMSAARRDVLHMLTQAPVTSVNELPRAAEELKIARQIRQRL